MFKNALLHALQVYLTHQNVNAAQLVVLNATQIFMVQQQNIVRQTANLIWLLSLQAALNSSSKDVLQSAHQIWVNLRLVIAVQSLDKNVFHQFMEINSVTLLDV